MAKMDDIGALWIEARARVLSAPTRAERLKQAHDEFYAALEEYATEQYDLGYAGGVFDTDKHMED